MKTESMSFADILREKMSDSLYENKGKSPSSEPQLKNASSTEIHEKIDFETVFFTAKKYSRSASLTAKKAEKAAIIPSVEVTLEVNSLSKEAFFALEMMKNLGALELNCSKITLSLVKKAFRRLCSQYHPDKIPSFASPQQIQEVSLKFSQLKTAKDELEEFFTLYNKSNNKAA